MISNIRFLHALKDNLSNARKTFRLLKFLDDFKGVERLAKKKKKPSFFKWLGFLGHYASFMYYISDNILFFITLLVKS